MNSDCDENKNKYYILQLLKNITDDSIMLWTRYGRVGRTGGSNKEVMADVESGIQAYEKIFAQKTGKGKGYQPIQMKLGKEEAFVQTNLIKKNDAKSTTQEAASVGYPDSKLD